MVSEGAGRCERLGSRSGCVACRVPSTCLTGQATITVKIRAYNSTGEVNIMTKNQIRVVAFILGTRVRLTCDVTGLPEDSEVLSYKWYHNCSYERCEIRGGDPYYRVVAAWHTIGGRHF